MNWQLTSHSPSNDIWEVLGNFNLWSKFLGLLGIYLKSLIHSARPLRVKKDTVLSFPKLELLLLLLVEFDNSQSLLNL